MTGMQQVDAASDYYVPRHAAWLINAEPAVADAPDAITEPIAPEPLATAQQGVLGVQGLQGDEPTQYQFPVMYAPPGQDTSDDYVTITEPKKFWRGRKPGGAPRSISST